VDTFKIGDPDVPIRGVVTTFMATSALMRAARDAGANFIVSHEPIFYNHFDRTEAFESDPVYRAKVRFVQENGLVVWRFHDHWHKIKPEPMSTETIRLLGWERFADPASIGFFRTFTRPPIALDDLVREIGARLPNRSLRVIGDPALPVRRIGHIGHSLSQVISQFETCDVVVAPEIREAECIEYMRDALALGLHKGLILTAHEAGEETGMERCANWLWPLADGVPVRFIPSGDTFRLLRYA
jgi:putative NIF3 family GTP cyclohydrolase 1 type 2